MRLSILFTSRSGNRFLVAWVVLAAVAVVWSGRGLKIDLTQQYPPNVMALPELCALLLSCLGVIVLRPHLWAIDRLGTPSRRWIPAVTAAATGMVGPQMVLLVAKFVALPQDVWSRSAANILLLSALAYLFAPFVGTFAASGSILMLYFALACALQMEPAVWPWSPMVASTGPDGRWPLAVIAAAAAITVAVKTLGRTLRTWGRDLDLA